MIVPLVSMSPYDPFLVDSVTHYPGFLYPSGSYSPALPCSVVFPHLCIMFVSFCYSISC